MNELDGLNIGRSHLSTRNGLLEKLGVQWLVFVVCHDSQFGFQNLGFFLDMRMQYEIIVTIYGLYWSLMLMLRIFKVKITGILEQPPKPPIMVIIDARIILETWAHSPITFKHMSLWLPFLSPHLTAYHSNTMKRSNRRRHIHLTNG